MEISTKHKKGIVQRAIDSRDIHPNNDSNHDLFQAEYAFEIAPIQSCDVKLNHQLRMSLRRPGDDIQLIMDRMVQVNNEHLVGERFYDAIIDSLHDPVIDDFKRESFKIAVRAANWYVDRKRNTKLSPAQEIAFFFNSVVTSLLQYTVASKTGIGLLFNPFIHCLVREYFRKFTFKHTDWYSSEGFKPDYSQEIQSVREFMEHADQIFTLNDYVNNQHMAEQLSCLIDAPVLLDCDHRSRMIYDIGEMIPVLMRNWDPLKHPIPLSDNFVAYFDISKSYPEVIFAGTSDAPKQIKNSSYTIAWNFCSHEITWMLDQWSSYNGTAHLEAFFLPKLHEHLLRIYSKVTFRVDDELETDYSHEIIFEQALHAHLQSKPIDSNSSEVDSEIKSAPSLGISPLRWNRFEKHMSDYFQCTFDSGKGSEIKIQRPGSKIYSVGHHKKNPLISSWMIKKILNRLGVQLYDWSTSLQYL